VFKHRCGPIYLWYHYVMAQSIRDTTKRGRGRPKTTGKGDPVMVRIQPDMAARLDDWRSRENDRPSRPEAIRRLVDFGLTGLKTKRGSK
jgi:hypothetical protein